MKITETKISIRDLVKNYSDDGDGGVFGYNNKLTIRPSFQREFVYKDKQRDAVIETIINGFPLNTMYWSKIDNDYYEVLDGQQRTISIGQFVNGDFTIKIDKDNKFFHNLSDNMLSPFPFVTTPFRFGKKTTAASTTQMDTAAAHFFHRS